MIKKITIAITMAVVGILMVTGIVIPILQSFENTTYIKYNNAKDTLSKIETGVSEVEIESFDPFTITVNGEIYNGVSNRILFMSDRVLINGYNNEIGLHIDNGDGTQANYNALTSLRFIVDGQSNTITVYFSNATVTDQTVTLDYGNWGYCMDPNGDYSAIVVWRNMTVYLNDLNQLHLANSRYENAYTSGTGDQVRIGTETQTATVKTHTIDNVRNLIYLNLTTSAESSDYYYAQPNGMSTIDLQARYIVVPLVVYGEKIPEHDYATLLNTLPIFMVIGLLIGVVGFIRYKP